MAFRSAFDPSSVSFNLRQRAHPAPAQADSPDHSHGNLAGRTGRQGRAGRQHQRGQCL